MFNLIKDEFDENINDIMNSVNKILQEKNEESEKGTKEKDSKNS